jgi:multiple sugar transport system ATP-binding protein
MIYVTHDQVEALTLADRIAVMHGGVIQQLDTPHNIYHRPANRFVAGFVGSPTMNFRNGRLNGDGTVFEADGLSLPLAGYPWRDGRSESREVELGVRPEHVAVGAGGREPLQDAEVELVEPMGAETIVWCRVAGKPLSVRLDGDADVKSGERLAVRFPIERMNIFDAATGARL